MNIEFIDGLIMPVITAACLCIGYVMKKWLPTDDKWIPTVLLIIGAISGLILFGADYEGIVKGMVSGVAAVGLHQVFKQHLHIDCQEMTEEEGLLAIEESEYLQNELAAIEKEEDDE